MTTTRDQAMTQISFAEAERAGHRHQTRREKLLRDMEVIVPWTRLMAAVEAVYPKRGNGRRPIGLERMLRLYVLQLLFGLSEAAVEDALYDTPVFARFVGIDLRVERAPDATTLLRFRHLLERHDLNRAIFEAIGAELRAKGLMLKQGTLIDATIIAAPSSTKNAEGRRDPEMHSTRKGNNWSFGMKMHAGVDAESGLVHSAEFTAAHAGDVTQSAGLLHGEETDVFADAGYTGVEQREEVAQCSCRRRNEPQYRRAGAPRWLPCKPRNAKTGCGPQWLNATSARGSNLAQIRIGGNTLHLRSCRRILERAIRGDSYRLRFKRRAGLVHQASPIHETASTH